MGNLKEAST